MLHPLFSWLMMAEIPDEKRKEVDFKLHLLLRRYSLLIMGLA